MWAKRGTALLCPGLRETLVAEILYSLDPGNETTARVESEVVTEKDFALLELLESIFNICVWNEDLKKN